MKLYTTLPLSKLASFMTQGNHASGEDKEKEIALLRAHLLCFKHKMKNIVWTKGTSGLDGQFHSGSEVTGLVIYLFLYFFQIRQKVVRVRPTVHPPCACPVCGYMEKESPERILLKYTDYNSRRNLLPVHQTGDSERLFFYLKCNSIKEGPVSEMGD